MVSKRPKRRNVSRRKVLQAGALGTFGSALAIPGLGSAKKTEDIVFLTRSKNNPISSEEIQANRQEAYKAYIRRGNPASDILGIPKLDDTSDVVAHAVAYTRSGGLREFVGNAANGDTVGDIHRDAGSFQRTLKKELKNEGNISTQATDWTTMNQSSYTWAEDPYGKVELVYTWKWTSSPNYGKVQVGLRQDVRIIPGTLASAYDSGYETQTAELEERYDSYSMYDYIVEFGPKSTTGTTSYSVDLQGGFSWSTTHSNAQIDNVSDSTQGELMWDMTFSWGAQTNTRNPVPGSRAEIDEPSSPYEEVVDVGQQATFDKDCYGLYCPPGTVGGSLTLGVSDGEVGP